MELGAGYKQTEVGVIPNEWDVISFGKLFDFQNGVNADKDAYGSGIGFINVLEVITNAHLRRDCIPGKVTLAKSAISAFAVSYGDVLFNRTSETQEEVALSSVYIDNESVVFGGFVIRGKPNSSALDPVYAGYALRSPQIRAQIVTMGQGAIRANVGQKDLAKTLAPLPPLPEQRGIATALSDVDALIASLDALIAKKRDVQQAALQQLLTGKTRLPGFKGEWRTKRLGDLCSMKSGEGITAKDIDDFSPFPCFGGNGLRGYTTRYTHNGRYCLIGRVGALCGNLLQVSGQFFASEHAIVAAASEGTDVGWLTLALGALSLNRRAESSAQPVLTVSKLVVLEVLSPPTEDEQSAIAEVIAYMDAELAALEARSDKAKAIKRGMMQELLTGRIRLV